MSTKKEAELYYIIGMLTASLNSMLLTIKGGSWSSDFISDLENSIEEINERIVKTLGDE